MAPSFNQEFRDWKMFVRLIGDFYRKYKIRIFKIDAIRMCTKEAEDNLERMTNMASVTPIPTLCSTGWQSPCSQRPWCGLHPQNLIRKDAPLTARFSNSGNAMAC